MGGVKLEHFTFQYIVDSFVLAKRDLIMIVVVVVDDDDDDC